MQHEKERLVGRPGVDELDPEVAGDVGAVPRDRELAGGQEKLRIVVGSLTGQHDPAVEAGRFAAEMPLADHSGVVARRLEPLGAVVPPAIEGLTEAVTGRGHQSLMGRSQ